MSDRYALARTLLERHFGFSAFRPLQARVVYSVLRGRDVLGVLPTAGGKSVCFQIPAMAVGGYRLVIWPLMRFPRLPPPPRLGPRHRMAETAGASAAFPR